MNYESECPKCGSLNAIELFTWDDSLAYPCFCGICDYFFWIERTADVTETVVLAPTTIRAKYKNRQKCDIPPLELKTQVFICNKEHKLFLERGIIVKKDHKHYRLRFSSLDERLNKKCLWVPDHWVDVIPKELLGI